MRLLAVLSALFCAAGVVACGGGGGGSSPGGSMSLPQTPQSTLISVGSSGANVALPALPGVTSSVQFAAGDAPDGTQIAVATSLTGVFGAVPAATRRATLQRGSMNVVFFVTFTVPHDVTLAHAPAFTFTLPSGASTYQQFYYAVSDPAIRDALRGYRTEGPGAVNGGTVTIGASQAPITLHAGVAYVFAFYDVDSGQTRLLGTWHTTFGAGTAFAHAIFTLKLQIYPAGTSPFTVTPCVQDPACGNPITLAFDPRFGNSVNDLGGQTVSIDGGFLNFAQTAELLRRNDSSISAAVANAVATPSLIGVRWTTVGAAFFPNGGSFANDTIDHVDTHYDAVTVSSPGSDPNHDGIWTDMSTTVTILVYGHPQ